MKKINLTLFGEVILELKKLWRYKKKLQISKKKMFMLSCYKIIWTLFHPTKYESTPCYKVFLPVPLYLLLATPQVKQKHNFVLKKIYFRILKSRNILFSIYSS